MRALSTGYRVIASKSIRALPLGFNVEIETYVQSVAEFEWHLPAASVFLVDRRGGKV